MNDQNIENNIEKKYKKIPLVLVLLIIGGIFLFVWLAFYYHHDQIDNLLTDQVKFYSHWQTKKVFKNNNDKINLFLNQTEKIKPILPDNFKEKLQNSSEFALVYFDNQWISIFKPNNNAVFDHYSYRYKKFVFEGITNQQTFNKLINKQSSLARFKVYRLSKLFDTSLINIFINDFAQLPIQDFFAFKKNIDKNSFWQVSLINNQIIIKTKKNITNNFCENNITAMQGNDFKYYINNINVQNDIFKNIPILQNLNSCVDLKIVNHENWQLMAPIADLQKIKESISNYFAYKYPIEQKYMLPNYSLATHYVAAIENHEWQNIENYWQCGNDQEKYYLIENKNYFLISNKKPTNDQNISYLTNDTTDDMKRNVLIHNPEQFIFDNITIDETQRFFSICVH